MFMKSAPEQTTAVPFAHPMTPAFYRVRRRRRETYDTFTIELDPPEGVRGLAFAPGQFNLLYAFGVGEAPISISGSPERPNTLIHTIRNVGAVSKALSRMAAGDLVGVRGPFGSAWPVEQGIGRDVVIVAGGIGLAPLRPALYAILARRKEFQRVALLYGARTPDDLLYVEELERWRSRLDMSVLVTVDRAMGDWRGAVGVVTTLIHRTAFDPASALAMVCGPEIMMRFTILELQKHGIQQEQIYISMERNMKCAVGFCGHCQLGPTFICKDGPVFRYDHIRRFSELREV
jgi:NAD(P)H-flavin reductase